ncbi:MAG TPA: Gfo/Idh/MocA family oxidoreductase, partial [Chloroflexota bacterium]|nr:Gfo/Idh/MocA family oxidoreductase [Chloroflexota bacterium]
DVGVHVLDLALWLMGNPKPVSVLGSAYRKFGNRDDVFNRFGPWNHTDYDVEDFATAMIRLEGGATLNLECSWALNIEEDLQSVVLCGDEGGAQLHPLKVFKDDGQMLIDWDPQGLADTNYIEMHARSLANFVDAVINDTEPLVRPEHGLHVAQIVDAIYRSSETGQLAEI